jgi:hypothetical protein
MTKIVIKVIDNILLAVTDIKLKQCEILDLL